MTASIGSGSDCSFGFSCSHEDKRLGMKLAQRDQTCDILWFPMDSKYPPNQSTFTKLSDSDCQVWYFDLLGTLFLQPRRCWDRAPDTSRADRGHALHPRVDTPGVIATQKPKEVWGSWPLYPKAEKRKGI